MGKVSEERCDSWNSGSYSAYVSNIFPGKSEQQELVCDKIREMGYMPENLIESEVSWFYTGLGIDDLYFQIEDVEVIARHVLSIYGAKVLSYARSDRTLDIALEKEAEENSVYINTSEPGISTESSSIHEKIIDEKYLDGSCPERAYRLESYRSVPSGGGEYSPKFRIYFVRKCKFRCANPTPEQAKDVNQVADLNFLGKISKEGLESYSDIMNKALNRTGLVINSHAVPYSTVRCINIAYKQRTTHGFFSSLSDLYHCYGLYSPRKYVEQFSNGITVVSLYLDKLPDGTRSNSCSVDDAIYQVIREASLSYCIPSAPLKSFFMSGNMSAQEVRYAYSGWIFAQHFLNKLGSEYIALNKIISNKDPIGAGVLQSIRNRLRTDSFTPQFIHETIEKYPELVKVLYMNFAVVHYITPSPGNRLSPTLSYQRMENSEILTEAEILKKICTTVSNSQEKQIFESFLTFNKHVLKTNFYQPTKVALSFRLNPGFLSSVDYPAKPYGIFLVIGSEFRGFHVRFEDIGRGGIRLVKSRNLEAYNTNVRNLFEENYNLAFTQQKKNKDIPEGGSKGTILLEYNHQDKDVVAFEKYVDSIMDLLVVGKSPGIKEKIIDLHNKDEMLFFGPDEGTADLMNWACEHARARGLPFWRTFSTGKSQSMGGIPHDLYGMTTASIREYMLGIFDKLKIEESQVTKFQTGGPDGDLGSNEILTSNHKTIAVVDGSGVIYDPLGLNRNELCRLARKRIMIDHFDTKLLSENGFRVLVDENDVTLPGGKVVESGLHLRNIFHLSEWAEADLFVPCGGRPESIDANTIGKLFKSDGTPKFKYIVEGANLFLTQDARLVLEKAGVIVYKDSSANKGGVTSSSLEVLAALVLNDEEYEKNMCVKDGVVPPFYEKYVNAVKDAIRKNAVLEFNAIWKESERTGVPKCIISDNLSNCIIKLTTELRNSNPWDKKDFASRVIMQAVPEVLREIVPHEEILKRLPESYSRSIFASYLASLFVYEYGMDPAPLAFLDFMRSHGFS